MSIRQIQAKWWFLLGQARAKRKDWHGALPYFERGLDVLPNHLLGLAYAGYCLDGLGRYDEAVQFYERALQNKPDFAYVHIRLARNAARLQHPQEVLASLNRAFRMQPGLKSNLGNQLLLAKAMADLGNSKEALTAYEKASKLDPTNVEALTGIGWGLRESGNIKEAETPLRAAIKLDPNYASPHEILGGLLRDSNRNMEAIPIWERLVELKPTSNIANANLGWALDWTGRHREALDRLQATVALKPDSSIKPTFSLYESIGACYFNLQEYTKAIDAEERALAESASPNADIYSVIAAAKVGLKDYEGAISAAQHALGLNPAQIGAWHYMGVAYLETGQIQKAIANFENVFKFDAVAPDTHLQIGLAYLKLGNKPAALEQCELLHTIAPDQEQELRNAIAAGSEQ